MKKKTKKTTRIIVKKKTKKICYQTTTALAIENQNHISFSLLGMGTACQVSPDQIMRTFCG